MGLSGYLDCHYTVDINSKPLLLVSMLLLLPMLLQKTKLLLLGREMGLW
jgi:hypothetical protein